MFQNQRLDEILNIIEECHYIGIGELAKRLYVSQATVRRDLAILEKNGLVIRDYGGVARQSGNNRFVRLDIRAVENHQAKTEIARRAAELVEDGDALFLDASSTVLCMIPFLKKKNLTVITNSLRVAEQLGESGKRIYMTGGLYLESSGAFAGGVAEKTLRGFHADKLFFSATGVSAQGIISDYSELEAQLRQTMIRQADRRYFLCDSSKYEKQYLFSIGSVSEMTEVISEKPLPFQKE